MIQDVPRIIPYSLNRKTKKLEFKACDGLLEYQDSILYLKDDYEQILSENYDFLDNIRKIRNKYEHKMHGENINHQEADRYLCSTTLSWLKMNQ